MIWCQYEYVTNILGIWVIPDSEKIIVASNRGEYIVLEDKSCLLRIAFDNTIRLLFDEEIDLLYLNNWLSKNPVKSIFENFLKKSNS